MPVHCQRVLRPYVPAVNRFDGTSSSKKVTQDHEIVRKIGKRANDQNEVSAIFTMKLENLCERGARGYLGEVHRIQVVSSRLLQVQKYGEKV